MSPLVTEANPGALDRAIAEIPGRVRRMQWKLVRETAHDILKDRQSPPINGRPFWIRTLRALQINTGQDPIPGLKYELERAVRAYRTGSMRGSYMGVIDARAMLVVARFDRRRNGAVVDFSGWRK
jgi:hypothetical protein